MNALDFRYYSILIKLSSVLALESSRSTPNTNSLWSEVEQHSLELSYLDMLLLFWPIPHSRNWCIRETTSAPETHHADPSEVDKVALIPMFRGMWWIEEATHFEIECAPHKIAFSPSLSPHMSLENFFVSLFFSFLFMYICKRLPHIQVVHALWRA